MGKVKQWSVEKKDAIEKMLIDMWASLGMDIPSNYEDIVQYCYEDVCETADPENWHSGDVAIAFRRWIEQQYVDKSSNYFKVTHTGYCKDAQREEIRIHAGENGNIVIYQDDDKLGFIVDVYGQTDHVNTMAIWEEDLAGETDDLLEESNDPRNFSDVELTDFKDEWGQYNDEICANLDIDEEGAEDYLMGDYFWLEDEEKWYPKCSSMYSEREQAIADYLRLG